ncbi:MAG TPA: circularly permuted type 2 ATP-grasp protein [Polyangiaceae bacterium]|nr:circularly permuted type 2 ATP-grasp protein [Polyangiaceae bacterium]
MALDSWPYLGSPNALERHVTAFDEFRDAGGALRAHQSLLERFLAERSPAELDQLQKSVRWRITEQEVTFNILGVPEGTNRPWHLDVLPYLVERNEWLALCRGLRQRARLLNEIIADCYGPQRLVREGLLPAELVLGHPDFLRPCHGWEPLGRHRLHLYAVDLGRDANGKFTVYSDRTQAPTGAGYALENRLVMGRTLPDLFRDYRVERIASFFAKMRRTVESLAPKTNGGQPRVLLLSAGARDESSFEHAYLARYLGYELVEGRDLTVRDNVVYLKTLSGLRRVDVLLRRVGDAWCDALALRGGSMQGIAGLVSAARAGNVGLANPLGSVITEMPALKAYLPALARAVLGEELMVESVPTFWCGDSASLSLVLGSLNDMVVKPAFGDRRGDPFVPAQMDEKARAALIERLKAHPNDFVAERWTGLSTVPVWGSGAVVQGGLAWRAFLCRDEDDYDVMPGGLARINESPDGLFLAIRSNAVSKDVWVPSAAGSAEPMLPSMPVRRVDLKRGGLDLPSRLLDDIYWLGRYVERCDCTARLVRAGIERATLEAAPDAPLALGAILDALQRSGVTPNAVDPNTDEARPGAPNTPAEAILLGVLFDAGSTTNLRAILRRVHELTLGVRSRLSRDAWHVLRRLSNSIESLPSGTPEKLGNAVDVLDQILITLAAVSGTTLDNMVRSHAWAFLDMGRRVERGALSLVQLQALLPPGASRVHMEALLEVADSLLTYRARYLSTLQVAPVVDLLLTDTSNPRSVAFQVEALMDHFKRLQIHSDVTRTRAERRLISLQSTLLTADIEQACAGDGSGLRQLLEESATLLWQFSDDVGHTFFSHLASSRAVSPPVWINEDLEAK